MRNGADGCSLPSLLSSSDVSLAAGKASVVRAAGCFYFGGARPPDEGKGGGGTAMSTKVFLCKDVRM